MWSETWKFWTSKKHLFHKCFRRVLCSLAFWRTLSAQFKLRSSQFCYELDGGYSFVVFMFDSTSSFVSDITSDYREEAFLSLSCLTEASSIGWAAFPTLWQRCNIDVTSRTQRLIRSHKLSMLLWWNDEYWISKNVVHLRLIYVRQKSLFFHHYFWFLMTLYLSVMRWRHSDVKATSNCVAAYWRVIDELHLKI